MNVVMVTIVKAERVVMTTVSARYCAGYCADFVKISRAAYVCLAQEQRRWMETKTTKKRE